MTKKFTYDDISKFMDKYFDTYNKYAQKPETTQRMCEFFAEDLQFVPAVAGLKGLGSRDEFLRSVSSHPSHYEQLKPEDIIIDDRKKTVVVLAFTELSDTKTGEIVVVDRYLVRYQLIVDANETLKIRRMLLFKKILSAADTLKERELIQRDPVTAQSYTD
jgi:hypothetical protein